MAIFISSGLTLSPAVSPNYGIIGYKNYATTTNLSATSETAQNPVTNMANPATAYRWEASSNASQVLTINTSGQDIDYIGIARHNLDQQGLTMTVKYDGVEVIPASGVSSKQAIIFLTQLAAPNTVTIEIDGATTAPSIAVLYVGLSIRLQRNIYVGHTPITYGRDRVAINGVSENGQYLGEIVVRETNSTSVNLQNLTPDWYRSTLDPFFALSPRVPCFWAWRPDGYPDEVSYCWVEGNPRPTNQRSNGMMEVSWNFKGVA